MAAASTISATFLLLLFLSAAAQPQRRTPTPPPNATDAAPPPESDTCNGIWITYQWNSGKRLHPIRSSPKQQPYSFKSQLNILNNDDVELKSWQVFLGFQHSEILVSSDGAVLANGTSLPALVGNGTVLAGFPNADLKTGIQTAGDLIQMSATVLMQGTQFGVGPPKVPLPSNVSLVNEGYSCHVPTNIGNSSIISTCCVQDPNAKSNMTISNKFLPRQNGDLTIMYDVTNAYADKYFAEVTMTNHNPLGRLDYWQLSWDWTLDEFIYSMKGAYPNIVDTNDCLTGPQGKHYTSLDFSTVLNCQRRPTIIDLPPQYANDTALGKVPFCCRNGTILPPGMDESKSTSAFEIQVFKMPPNLNQSSITPPQNWQIKGVLNPDYKCGPPVRVSPSQFPSPTGLRVNTTAVASWQVVCNITQPKNASPKCCVSFSTYFNESIIPCKTCACGCSKNAARTCSTTASAMFIPPEAQLVPFENRTKLALAWADIQHRRVPDPLPCSDNCGVSINWHVLTDYNKGWSARVTLFNWEDVNYPDWFVAAELDKAALGFQKAYSFNGTILTDVDNTIFMQGLPGLNYLVGEANGTKLTDPRVTGKQQSVLSFTKKTTPGIRVGERDGFPTKVYFNGEECSLPSIIPTNGGFMMGHFTIFPVLLSVLILIFIDQ